MRVAELSPRVRVSQGLLTALARLAQQRPRQMVAAGVVLALTAGAIGGSASRYLEPYAPSPPPGTQSRHAADLIARASGVDPDSGLIAAFDARSPARARRVGVVLASDPTIAAVVRPPRAEARPLGRGGARYLVASYRASVSAREQQQAARRLARRLHPLGVQLGGSGAVWAQGNDVTTEDFRRAELISFPFLFLLSLWFFRGAGAALVAAAFGALSIAVSLLLLRVLGSLMYVSIFALNIIVALGVGLAFDYCLLVINRYREELARGRSAHEAIEATLTTSGRAIAFSALTVAAALCTMVVFPDRALSSMGVAGAAVTLSSCLLALCVLPSALFLLGRGVNGLSPAWLRRAADRESRPLTEGAWYSLARLVTRRPAIFAIAASAALLLLAAPALRINLTQGAADLVPPDHSAHRVDDLLRTRFAPAYATTPVRVAVAHAPSRAVAAFAARLARLEDAALTSPPRRLDRTTSEIDVVSRAGPLAASSQRLVRAIRREAAPFPFAVGGESATLIDSKASLRDHLPAAIALALGTTMLALFLLTGSVVLPVKTVVMNLLSISATLGLMVLVFQDGRLERLLGYHTQGGLILTIPPFVAALAFGLATDYGIFVISRIKEHVNAGAPNADATALGVERTGRLVTAAALLFAVAVGATVTSHMLPAKETGLGMVAAVTIDAFVVRTFLVPSLMALLGRLNWWAPRPLRRLAERAGLGYVGRATSTTAADGDAA
jgi:uncharacterized membrane protein YdfJ with MMPL/SSD domain